MASIPEEKRFTKNHIWIEMENEFIGRCGITEYCLEKISDVVFVDFPETNMEVKMNERVGIVESHTFIYTINSPVSGRITELNKELEFNPDLINKDPLETGWIFKIDIKEPNEFDDLMDLESYNDYIEFESDL